MAPSSLVTFTNNDNWQVPNYVDKIFITCEGGDGGDSSDEPGGTGGLVSGDATVDDSDTLYARFPSGGAGQTGSNGDAYAQGGAGGAGASVRKNGTGLNDDLITAGGGGGGGAADTDAQTGEEDHSAGADGGGVGQNASGASTSNKSVPGGEGGAASGETGTDGEAPDESGDPGADAVANAPGGGGGGHNGGLGGDTADFNNDDYAESVGSGGGGGDGYTGGVTNASSTVGGATNGPRVEIEYADRVSDLSADDSVANEVTLSWSQPFDVDSINIYRAESTGTAPGDYTQIASGLSANTTSYTDTGLEDGEQYYYRVENVNSWDNRLSNEPTGVMSLPEPTDLDGSYDGTSSNLTWTNNDGSADGDISIERSTDDGSTWTTIASGLSKDATSYSDGGISPYNRAIYRVNRHASDVTATSATKEMIVAGSSAVTDADGVRQTDNGVVKTE